MASISDLTTKESPTWCMGCGDFSILSAIKNAISQLNIEPHNVLISSGIGCGSKTPHFIKTYGFEGLHGRSLPVATGFKLSNHKMKVIAVAGDGDTYGIGGNHFIHTMRRNIDMTLIVQNNAIYGLTKGQTSPTSQKGFKSNSTPSGVLEEAVNPISTALTWGATFIARGFAFDVAHLVSVVKEAISHRGFSLVDVFQPCVTYNRINTMEWYKQRVYDLTKENHDSTNWFAAMEKALEWGDRIPIGVFYKTQKPTYEDGLPQIKDKALVEQDISNVDIRPLLKKYM